MNDIKEKLNQFAEMVAQSATIAIMAHNNPDGDALCSVLGLCHLIELNFGKSPVCLYDGNIPGYLDVVPLRDKMVCVEQAPAEPFDLVIVLDCGALYQMARGTAILAAAKDKIEIDHHHKEDDGALAELNFNDDTRCATAEIIDQMMRAADWVYDMDVLNLLTIGVLTDTGNLRFVRQSDPLRMMADFVDRGINIGYWMDALAVNPRRAVLTEAAVTSRAEFFHNGRLALATVPRSDYKNLDGKGALIMNLLGQIRGVEYVAVLKQQRPDQIGVSLRSRTHPVDGFARALGGGGHTYAAGAVVRDTLENVRQRVIDLFKGEE
ncbi:hypothetical protein HDR63_00745 [bacterium]|nr:hypothetical protein [bacterium]